MCLGTVLPLFQNGFFSFHDNTTVVRVFEMSNSLQSGMFPVRWAENLGYGYGYPIFNFYGPFPYYIGGALNLIGIDTLLATKTMIVLGMLLAPALMFVLLRKMFSTSSAVVGSIIYAYFPYHAVNLYVRGAIGELFAYAFLPLVFLGIYNLFKQQKQSSYGESIPSIAIFAFGIFLIAVSHNLSLLMLFLILPFIILIMLFFSASKRKFLVTIFLGAVLGLCLSAFYVLPAYWEMGYTNVTSQIGGGADFRDHYVCISQLWESQWGFGGSVPGCLDGLSFKLGKTNILLLLIALGIFAYRIIKKKFQGADAIALVGVFVFLLSLFLMLPISNSVWEGVSLMAYIQYPWRFINMLGFSLAVLVGYSFVHIPTRISHNNKLLLICAASCITILFNLKLFNPQDFNNLTTANYTDQNYMRYTVSKISDEYMPPNFSKPEDSSSVPTEKAEVLRGSGEIIEIEKKQIGTQLKYNFTTDGTIHINQAFFPAWKATINDKDALLMPTKNGINIDVQKGEGVVDLVFKQTPIERTGNMLSILAFFVIILGIMLPKSYGKKAS